MISCAEGVSPLVGEHLAVRESGRQHRARPPPAWEDGGNAVIHVRPHPDPTRFTGGGGIQLAVDRKQAAHGPGGGRGAGRSQPWFELPVCFVASRFQGRVDNKSGGVR